jgi:aconitate hydratase
VQAVSAARCLVKVGDSVTTDHISPAGEIALDRPAGEYLLAQGVQQADFNSYGSRRGNHEVMVRGTFANVRLRNELAPGTEGSWTTCFLDDRQMSIYAAAVAYREAGVPLVVLAGKEYGTGSSRDWAAKGPSLLGVRVVIAQSYERIHRSNLIGMGILPLQYSDGQDANSLGLTGRESFSIGAISETDRETEVTAHPPEGPEIRFKTIIRIDTPNEFSYFRHGGILHYVLRRLAG